MTLPNHDTIVYWFQNPSNSSIPDWLSQSAHEVVAVQPDSLPELKQGVIIVDCEPGQMDRLSVVCHHYQQPVLALVYDQDIPAALEAGAWDYLVKEQITSNLLDRVVRYAKNHQRVETQSNAFSRALFSAEIRLNNLIEKNPDGIVVVDGSGIIHYINEAAELLFNRPRARLLGSPMGFPIVSGDMTELEIARHDGQVTVVELRVVDTEWNEQAASLLILHDITPRRAAEEKIRYQANLLENVPEAIISIDMDYNVRSWNKGAETIYGWTETEVIGKSLVTLLQTVYDEDDLQTARAALQADGYWRGEVTHLRKDGSRVHIHASTTFIKDDHGKPSGMVSINQDITERKRLESELFESRLRQAEMEQEQELLNLKADFISMVSHEFRTPLTIIMSSSEIMDRYRDRLTVEKNLEHIRKIQEQAQHMTHLINDVLLITRAHAGKIEVNRTPIQVENFCQAMIEEVQIATEAKQQFIFNYQVAAETVLLDEKLMQHILVNLLSNAVKYSRGKDKIYFDVFTEQEAIIFRIKDEGIGIPESALAHLFEPFFRARNTGDIQGTGLGLVIVKNNVEAHGGTLNVESKEGIGTTFTASIPMFSNNTGH